jgi:type II secretory pathway component PulK
MKTDSFRQRPGVPRRESGPSLAERRAPGGPPRERRKGVALIIVLWLVAILTLLMYAFLTDMQVEYSLAGGYGDQKKAEQIAWSAIDYACATLINNPQTSSTLIDQSWSNDQSRFFEIGLGDGAFSIVHPTYDDSAAPMWGIEDEASKINLNTVTAEMLLKLPLSWMTEQIADSIIAWRDAKPSALPSAAEDSYYQSLNPPYGCKHQPFETIEELLYVAGVTQEALYGRDANLNGINDPGEQDSASHPDPGLFGLVTVWSVDKNQTAAGTPRLNLNTASQQLLQLAGMTQQEIQSTLAYRLQRGPFPTVAHLLGQPSRGIPPILAGARFKALADRFTVAPGATIPGLVNINTAPLQVLLALPGITQEIAVKLMAQRITPGANLSNLGWLTDVVTPEQLQGFANLITCRSYQFRIHAVGRIGTPYTSGPAGGDVAERPGAIKRMMAVFDMLATPGPRLVYWKDVTKVGMPYDPSAGPGTGP